MGEYEDRYPDAYGRGDEAGQRRDGNAEPIEPIEPIPETPPGERLAPRRQFGPGDTQHRERREAWQHARDEPVPTVGQPAPQPMRMIEPTPQSAGADYRGIGPRGYVRSPARVFEDVCDRLTDDPQIDASDIEVSISGVEITLAGSVDSTATVARVEALTGSVPGVKGVRNSLRIRPRPAAPDR